jgi:peroxiredoxin Q/BCP
MTNNTKTFLTTSLIAIAIVIAGVALLNSSKNIEKKEEATVVSNNLVGKPMPSVQLMDKDSKAYQMENLRGKNVVLFFNEGLMCYPACWNQIAAFGADPRFNSPETVAMSVVVDSPRDWQQAIAKMPELAKSTTLFDTNANTSRALGLLSAGSSMHAGQLPGHSYILIDKDGIVREVFDDPNMGIGNDKIMEKILKF